MRYNCMFRGCKPHAVIMMKDGEYLNREDLPKGYMIDTVGTYNGGFGVSIIPYLTIILEESP